MNNRPSLRVRIIATAAIAGAMLGVAAIPASAVPVQTDVSAQVRLLPGATFTRYAPKISGTAQVGKTLTATVGTVRPTGATVRYQWYRSGVAIYKATARTYKLTAKEYNKKITVKVTLSKSGYTTSARTSASTATVKAATIAWSAPVLRSVPTLGVPVSFTSGTISPTGTKATYQWLRDGVAIPGATASTYTPVANDVDRVLQVRVTRSLAGYTTASKSSWAGETVGEAAPALTGDDFFEVGVDIQPGTYYTNVTDDQFCFWYTADSEDSEEFNGAGLGDGRMYAVIEEGDSVFYTDGCGAWRAIPTVGAKATTVRATGGIFAVGVDILPGTYKTTTAEIDGCYWARLSSLSGAEESIIDDAFVFDTPTITVTIAETDKFFGANWCGKWTRVSE